MARMHFSPQQTRFTAEDIQTVKITKRPNRGAVRRLRLLFFAFICFLTWAGLTIWDQSAVVEEKMEQLVTLEEQLAELKAENEAYRKEIERLHDPEYIEQRLRKDYMMSRDGETLFIRTR